MFACAVSPDSSWIASAGDGPVRIWDAGPRSRCARSTGTWPGVGRLRRQCRRPAARLSCRDGAMRVWTVATGELRHVLTHLTAVWDCALSPWMAGIW